MRVTRRDANRGGVAVWVAHCGVQQLLAVPCGGEMRMKREEKLVCDSLIWVAHCGVRRPRGVRARGRQGAGTGNWFVIH